MVDLAKFVEDEFGMVASALQSTEPDTIWNKVPPRPRRGTYAYADGTNWNPGSGEGPYYFDGTAWTPMKDTTVLPPPVVLPPILRGYLAGLTLSTAGTSSTFSVSAGLTADSTNAIYTTLASTISKTTGAWTVGSGNGALDTGTIASSTWYHVWLIERTDLTVTDVLVSLSATTPTMPTNYTYKRRIGAMKTGGSSNWTKFIQNGDEFLWDVPVLDLSSVTIGTASVTELLSVPTGLSVNALFSAEVINSTTNNAAISFWCPDTTGPGSATAQALFCSNTTVVAASGYFNIRTNSSALISMRTGTQSLATTIYTYGWVDRRGRDT